MREERLSAEAEPATAGQSSGLGRPSAVAAHEKTVAEPLADEQRMKGPEVLRRLNKRGYRRGKTEVHELVERLRPQAVRPIRRFEGVAGELGQHDFGEVRAAASSTYSELGTTTALQPPQSGSS